MDCRVVPVDFTRYRAQFQILDNLARGLLSGVYHFAKYYGMEVPEEWSPKYDMMSTYYPRVYVDYQANPKEWFDTMLDIVGFLRYKGM